MIELPVLDAGFLGDWVGRLRTLTGPPVVGVLLRGSYARDAATAYRDVDLDVLVSGPTYEAYPGLPRRDRRRAVFRGGRYGDHRPRPRPAPGHARDAGNR